MMFLRDLMVKNRAFTAASIQGLYAAFEDSKTRLAQSLAAAGDTQGVHLSVVIRFDNQGYRVFSLPELERYFQNAKDIERVAFELETDVSLRSNRNAGAHCILQLDSRDPQRCMLQVASDNRAWLEQTFSDVSGLINKRRTVSRFVRTPVTQWLIQVCGVSLGILACIWIARLAAPALAIENPFLISFLVSLLIFSNTWSFLLQAIGVAIGKAFPNVMFLRADEERLHWVGQALVGGVLTAALFQVATVLWEVIAYAAKDILRR